MHIQALSYGATAPSSGAAAAAVTSDSLVIQNATNKVQVLAWWADNQLAGYHQMIRPSGHDTSRDVRAIVAASEVSPIVPIGVPFFVEPQETLGMTIAGSITAGDRELGTMLLLYKDLPGLDANMISFDQLRSRVEELVTIHATITTAGGGVDYSGAELITAESDLLKANYDYAVLGASCSVECCSLCLRGPDTGWVRVAVPGNESKPDLTAGWFGMLSRATGLPTIPVIRSGNRSQTYIDALQDENNTAVLCSWHLARLKR